MNKILFNSLIGFKYALPTLLCMVLILFNSITFSFSLFYRTPILFVLTVIFYFAVFRPMVLNVIVVFLLGIFADLLGSGLFGLHAFFFVLMFFVANLNRRFILTLNFVDSWLIFAFILGILQLVWWALFSLLNLMIPPFMPILFQYVVLVLTYPFFIWLCGWLDLKIGGPK